MPSLPASILIRSFAMCSSDWESINDWELNTSLCSTFSTHAGGSKFLKVNAAWWSSAGTSDSSSPPYRAERWWLVFSIWRSIISCSRIILALQVRWQTHVPAPGDVESHHASTIARVDLHELWDVIDLVACHMEEVVLNLIPFGGPSLDMDEEYEGHIDCAEVLLVLVLQWEATEVQSDGEMRGSIK
ncbi:hypothetical protein Cni_G13837 [Canna indica]|uniref:Uncharacterized protein n=1 Tax=Canna indica TaxID=4628 RepID=A0AAQ3QBU8_9LILI|nr:hypothetical protein Cni_G13837 [Canna indica]